MSFGKAIFSLYFVYSSSAFLHSKNRAFRKDTPCSFEIRNPYFSLLLTPISSLILILFFFLLFCRRNAVTKAALEKWSGNNIPVFKKDIGASKELDKLVSSLEEHCSYEPAGFNRKGIKQHILDVFNERRRRRRKGHDYSQVSIFSSFAI